MIAKLFSFWFGRLTREELKKFLLLSLIFCFLIGVHWLLRTLKDSTFITINGCASIPYVKWFSFLVSLPLIACYGHLVNLFDRYRLFYFFCAIYCALTFLFAFLLYQEFNSGLLGNQPNRVTGWLFYVFAESYGSIMITLFWAFLSDITTPDEAKKGYGLIAMGGQLGNILGPLSASCLAQSWGTPLLACLAALGIFMMIPLMQFFIATIDKSALRGFHGTNEKTMEKEESKLDFAQGLGILFARPYLLGIFGIVCLYELVYTIFDFRFKTLAGLVFQGECLTQYLGECGVLTGAVSVICLLAGLSNLPRWLGLTISLALSPILMILLTFVSTSPSIHAVAWVTILANALNYALNQPTREQLYIPTTHDVKYKTKAWIEIFGFRASKAIGSGINLVTSWMGIYFLFFSTTLSLGLISVWLITALFLGKTHQKAVATNRVIC